MADTLTMISAAELINKILAGERDLSNTKFQPGKADLSAEDGFAELNKYVAGITDLRENGFTANNIDWAGVRAPGLFLQSVKMPGANLAGADLRGADMRRSDMTGANLTGANLSGIVLNNGRYIGADFSDSDMTGAEFYEANFSKARFLNVNFAVAYTVRANFSEADFTGSELGGANFYRSDLRGAIGLEAAHNLASCAFKATVVTARERDIIEAARSALPLFDLRTEMSDPPRR
jgi:uncharacterized protein YjbI with pentapeptide repeats